MESTRYGPTRFFRNSVISRVRPLWMSVRQTSEEDGQTHLPASADSHEWWTCMRDRFPKPTTVAIPIGMNKEINRFVAEDILSP